MRLLVLSFVSLAGILYTIAAFEVYREEARARNVLRASDAPPTIDADQHPPRHPETNLGRLRVAFASDDYTDDLHPYLERALTQAPTFYQPPFLLAAFYANRLERPDTIERGFEAALARFPSNGRLHLTYAEWLLTPRATAPYRTYRSDTGPGGDRARETAMHHVERATTLEPDLTSRALELLSRFRIPIQRWTEVLPDNETTRQLVLHALDRASPFGQSWDPGAAESIRDVRREFLTSYLGTTDSSTTLQTLAILSRKWSEPELALSASEQWHERALEDGAGPALTRATLSLARDCLDADQSERAYRVTRASLSEMEERGFAEDSAELLVGVGNLYLARRQLAMAESLFTEAATRFPNHAPAFLGLAHAHQRAGDDANALDELRRVLELDPENARARTMLDSMLREQ